VNASAMPVELVADLISWYMLILLMLYALYEMKVEVRYLFLAGSKFRGQGNFFRAYP
jgi:hypothetical protein